MAKDLYEVLGVSKGASDDEIKSAYRKLAKKYHPDAYSTASETEKKNAEEKFKEISHAYSVLSDKQKKANYDQFGSEDGPQGFGGGSYGGGDFGGFEDILNNIFSGFGGGGGFGGRSANPNAPQKGADIRVRLTISFEEAYNGVTKQVKIQRTVTCPGCHGSGAKDASSIKTCPSCNGTGFITRSQSTIFGKQMVRSVCSACGGKGKIITDKCKTCRGAGTIRKESVINVPIPAGVNDGVTLRFSGEGNSGVNGGRNGDFIVDIAVVPSKIFTRAGNDLYIEVPISFYDAAAGCDLKIHTMKGDAKCSVPAGIQSGTKIRMKGYGMKVMQKESYGDLLVTIKVNVPKGLDKKQLKVLKEFDDSLSRSQATNAEKF